MIAPDEDMKLPVLRSDLKLREAPPEPDGMPSWTIYDPAANQYYKIGWMEFECLSRFNDCKLASELCAMLQEQTALQPDLDTIKALLLFLISNNLVVTANEGSAAYFEEKRQKREKHWLHKLLHNYIFFTIPLFKPQAFLDKTYPYVSFMCNRYFMSGAFMLLFFGIFLSFQRMDEFFATFMNYLNFEGLVLLLVTTFFVKIIHEFGHTYTAKKFGVPVGVMGVAFIVMYPILYTETTNAWKLHSRKNRLYIAAAGMMSEVIVASIALLMWHLLDPGLLQSVCFMVAIVSLATSLVVNLNPLMKFDGYYLFSDLIGIDNLQDRAFAFSKWRLRRFVWGCDDSVPEHIAPDTQRLMTFFGYAVWVYRFFLYLGIGLLIYHVFFQPLGLILMIIELFVFIGLPVMRELSVWGGRWLDVLKSWRGRFLLTGLMAALVWMALPVHRTIEIPAIMHAENYLQIYTPIAAQVAHIHVRQGQRVEQGEALLLLQSVELDYNIQIVSQRLEDLTLLRDSRQANVELARQYMTIESEIQKTRDELDGYLRLKDQFNITAPFAGTIKLLDPSLHVGQWVNTNLLMALLANEERYIVSAYVSEHDIDRLRESKTGVFYPEYSLFRQFDVTLQTLDQTRIETIFWPELSSPQKGAIPAEMDRFGNAAPLPRYNYYAARFIISPPSPVENPHSAKPNKGLPDFVARGTIRISGTPRSPFKDFQNTVRSYLFGEVGL